MATLCVLFSFGRMAGLGGEHDSHLHLSPLLVRVYRASALQDRQEVPEVQHKNYMRIENLFFQLLQVAIGTRNALDRQPTSKEWALLFDMGKKQALVAIAMAGITRLNQRQTQGQGASDYGNSIGMDEMTYLKWLGLTAKVAQRNKQVSEACVELVKQYAHDGLNCCVLKGQGNLEYYPEELRECRTPGDIDVWCAPQYPLGLDIAVSDLDSNGAHYEKYHGIEAVIEYSLMKARTAGTPKPEIRYNNTETHGVWSWDVEIHHRPSMMNSITRNSRLQSWCRENEQFGVHTYNGFGVPTVSFNAVYQLSHIYTHLFDEGIGLRQLLDYYFVLRALHIEQGSFADRTQSMAQWAEGMGVAVKSNEEIMHTLSSFGMKKFAGAVMYVLQTVFAMPDEYLICKPDEKEGKFLLNEIMIAGNFGKYDQRIIHNSQFIIHNWEKTKHNLRLLKHYPEEVLWEPFFRVYHWIWRKLELWRY